jgi:transcriptional antiterminator NusG
MDNWYILHAKTGKEIEIKNIILRDIHDAKALVPQRILNERKDGQYHLVTRTLFPGYVFVKVFMDAESIMFYKLSGIPSVFRILGNDRGPQPVSEDEMQIVYRLSGDSDPLGISQVFYEGGNIQIISGPLQGLEGQIVKIDPRRYRAKVNVSLMGEPRIVELGINVINKI